MPNDLKNTLDALEIDSITRKLFRPGCSSLSMITWTMSGVALASCKQIHSGVADAHGFAADTSYYADNLLGDGRGDDRTDGGAAGRDDGEGDGGSDDAFSVTDNVVTEDSHDSVSRGEVELSNFDPVPDARALTVRVAADEMDGNPEDPTDASPEVLPDGYVDARGQYGSFRVSRNTVGEISWTYTLDNDDPETERLPESGMAVYDRLKVSVEEDVEGDSEEGNSEIPVIEVEILGANDRPKIAAITAAVTDNIAHDSAAVAPENILTGTFSVTDDAGSTQSFAVEGAIPLVFQEFTHRVDGVFGRLEYHEITGAYAYHLNQAAISRLGTGVSDADRFSVTATDEHGAMSVPTEVVINVTGANDRPVAWIDGEGDTRSATKMASMSRSADVTTFVFTDPDGDIPNDDITIKAFSQYGGNVPSYGSNSGQSIANILPGSGGDTHSLAGEYGTFHFDREDGAIRVRYTVDTNRVRILGDQSQHNEASNSVPINGTESATLYFNDGTDTSLPVTYTVNIRDTIRDSDTHGYQYPIPSSRKAIDISDQSPRTIMIDWKGEYDWFLLQNPHQVQSISGKVWAASYHVRVGPLGDTNGVPNKVKLKLQTTNSDPRQFWDKETSGGRAGHDGQANIRWHLDNGSAFRRDENNDFFSISVTGVGDYTGPVTIYWSVTDPCTDGLRRCGSNGPFSIDGNIGTSDAGIETSAYLGDAEASGSGGGSGYTEAVAADGEAGKSAAVSRTDLMADDPDEANLLDGTAGSEIIQGGGADDVISTGGGSDLVIGGFGDDDISLGDGEETIIYRFESGAQSWKAADGSDVVHDFTRGEDTLLLIDIASGDRIADYAAFKSSALRPVAEIIEDGDGRITGLKMIFSEDGTDHGSSGRVLTINFDVTGPLLGTSDIASKLDGTTLTCFCVLDDILGGEDFLQVDAIADLPVDVV